MNKKVIIGIIAAVVVAIICIGVVSWKLLIKYIHFVTNKRKKLYIEL